MADDPPDGLKLKPFPPGRSELFLFLFTNRLFLFAIAASWTAFSVWLSLRNANWGWFARSGSVLGIVGAVLSCRSVLRFTRAERVRIRNMTVVECFTPSELAEQERDSGATVLGVVLLLLGTLIWAYGDLLPMPAGAPAFRT
jgi:hypothetical protein